MCRGGYVIGTSRMVGRYEKLDTLQVSPDAWHAGTTSSQREFCHFFLSFFFFFFFLFYRRGITVVGITVFDNDHHHHHHIMTRIYIYGIYLPQLELETKLSCVISTFSSVILYIIRVRVRELPTSRQRGER